MNSRFDKLLSLEEVTQPRRRVSAAGVVFLAATIEAAQSSGKYAAETPTAGGGLRTLRLAGGGRDTFDGGCVGDSEYTLNVTMPAANLQSEAVKAIAGDNGEYL